MAIGFAKRGRGGDGALLRSLPIALLQLTGCANSHGMELPAATVGAAGAAAPVMLAPGVGAADLASKPVAAPAPTIGGGPVPQHVTRPSPAGPIDCGQDRFFALAPECPATVPVQLDAPCSLPEGVVCRYLFDAPNDPASAGDVVELACQQRSTTWSVSDAPCDRDCSSARTVDTPIAQIDTADCAQRPLAACEQGITEQAQLDSMLRSALGDPSSFQISLLEDALFVEFENGCPTQLFTGFHRTLEGTGPLVAILSRVRWACAVKPTCGRLDGPSTILTL